MQAKESASNKFTAPLRDTPKTVQVITREVLDQRGVNSLEEALRSTPGITFGAGEGGNPTGDQPYIRGINSQQSISIDGLRDIAAGSRETVILPFLMDRISRIKCSSMAAYHRWLDEAFHDYRTTTNGWHNPEYHLSC